MGCGLMHILPLVLAAATTVAPATPAVSCTALQLSYVNGNTNMQSVIQFNGDGTWTISDWSAVGAMASGAPGDLATKVAKLLIAQRGNLRLAAAAPTFPTQAACDARASLAVASDPIMKKVLGLP